MHTSGNSAAKIQWLSSRFLQQIVNRWNCIREATCWRLCVAVKAQKTYFVAPAAAALSWPQCLLPLAKRACASWQRKRRPHFRRTRNISVLANIVTSFFHWLVVVGYACFYGFVYYVSDWLLQVLLHSSCKNRLGNTAKYWKVSGVYVINTVHTPKKNDNSWPNMFKLHSPGKSTPGFIFLIKKIDQ